MLDKNRVLSKLDELDSDLRNRRFFQEGCRVSK